MQSKFEHSVCGKSFPLHFPFRLYQAVTSRGMNWYLIPWRAHVSAQKNKGHHTPAYPSTSSNLATRTKKNPWSRKALRIFYFALTAEKVRCIYYFSNTVRCWLTVNSSSRMDSFNTWLMMFFSSCIHNQRNELCWCSKACWSKDVAIQIIDFGSLTQA